MSQPISTLSPRDLEDFIWPSNSSLNPSESCNDFQTMSQSPKTIYVNLSSSQVGPSFRLESWSRDQKSFNSGQYLANLSTNHSQPPSNSLDSVGWTDLVSHASANTSIPAEPNKQLPFQPRPWPQNGSMDGSLPGLPPLALENQ
jgi:hypothetical protein